MSEEDIIDPATAGALFRKALGASMECMYTDWGCGHEEEETLDPWGPDVCCDSCRMLDIDGGPSPVMCCNHHRAKRSGYIISWSEDRKRRVSGNCPYKEPIRSRIRRKR